MSGASIIWKAILQSISLIKRDPAWKVGNGVQVRIGLDAWSGCGNGHILPHPLCNFLQDSCITHLSHITDDIQDRWQNQTWKDHRTLNILTFWVDDWQRFIGSLEEANVCINDNQDVLMWALDPQGRYSPKSGYAYTMAARHTGDFSWWWSHI